MNEQNTILRDLDNGSRDLMSELKRIDTFLSIPGISNEEIDRLLDRRNELSASKMYVV